ncbi:hypothetical protein PF010_g9613 [Phytophthora fragariae]|uniref:Uncharacterized protein n=1 Tax=Phytophthora fragariae TaxID=53985 RepID=A0A6A3KWU0_9STRA|nr:hypothetical protein PF011_g9175 [Phytophthora fragariae]KAE9114727.1 hypothetical protein PF010_g9613 [Phytophthora fragariae]KAE9234660.1 hypothetical protein PF004_g9334 [Phytophthora fragariae]KAE9318471.1 hypothetical protein PF008_g18506 [Phytophthora fragariae]
MHLPSRKCAKEVLEDAAAEGLDTPTVMSMPARLDAVIASKDGHTKY